MENKDLLATPHLKSMLGAVLMADEVLSTEQLEIAVPTLEILFARTADVATRTEVLEVLNATAASYLAMTTMERRGLGVLVHPRPFRGPSLADSVVHHPFDRL